MALFIHGGYWRGQSPRKFSHIARGLNEHGVRVAMLGYSLCPEVDVANIVEQVRQACASLWRRYRQPISIYGHSAGGHLAACTVATPWRNLYNDLPEDLVRTAYSISGIFDLTPLVRTTINGDLRLDEASAKAVSPLYWNVEKGRVIDVVVGSLESSEFLRQSRVLADEWAGKGAVTRFEAVASSNHFTVLDPLTDPNSTMTKRIVELCYLARSDDWKNR